MTIVYSRYRGDEIKIDYLLADDSRCFTILAWKRILKNKPDESYLVQIVTYLNENDTRKGYINPICLRLTLSYIQPAYSRTRRCL
jgi:hypothetical protein